MAIISMQIRQKTRLIIWKINWKQSFELN